MSKNYELLAAIGDQSASTRSLGSVRPSFESRPRRRERQTLPPAQISNHISNHTWLDTINVLQRHWRASIIFASLVWLTTIIVAVVQRPVYEPTATVEIDPAGPMISITQTGGTTSNDVEYLETEAKKLESDELLVAVIRSLHLDQNSEFVGKDSASPRTDWWATRWFRPQRNSGGQVGTGPGVIQLSEKENIALRSLRSCLTVKRDPTSRLVTAKVSSHDPALAAVVTNTLVNLFIERTYTTRHDAIMESSEWLAKQLDDVRATMQQSNAALIDYEKTWGIADLGEDSKEQSTTTQRIAQLNQELTQAQGDRIQLESYVKEGNEAAIQQVSNDSVLQSLTQKLADARTALSESEVIYGPNHPTVKKLKSQVEELQTQLAAQRNVIIGHIRTSYAAARERERLLEGELKGALDQGGRMSQYIVLKKEAQNNRELYDTLYMKVKEAGIAAESRLSNIRVVDRARVLDTPTRPHRMLIAAMGLIISIFGGVMIAYIRGNLDNTIHSSNDVKMITGISAISIMPSFPSSPLSTNASNVGALELSKKVTNTQLERYWGTRILLDSPRSAQAEALRGLQTSILLHGNGGPPQIVQVVSAFPREGKTTIAVNLAIALSTHGETCLVDADLRRPAVAQVFRLAPTVGLGEVLLGSAPLDAALVNVPDIKGLTVLPATTQTRLEERLFGYEMMRATLGMLRMRFKHVIVDSPPLIAYADGRAIVPLADGLILVGRSGYTTREAMAETVELLRRMNSPPIIDVVLNDVSSSLLDRGYYYPQQAGS